MTGTGMDFLMSEFFRGCEDGVDPNLQKGLFLYRRKLDTVPRRSFRKWYKGKGRFLSGTECKMLCEEGVSVCASYDKKGVYKINTANSADVTLIQLGFTSS